VDAIVSPRPGSVVLVERRFPPQGWALPGGFVDEGETVEAAVRRELREETGLTLHDVALFGVYSDPTRDPRGHTVSVVYTATASGTPEAGDDAARAEVFSLDALPEPIAFDHGRILDDYRRLWAAAGGDRT
jgi:8-oxo-dGTP diphosphatase